MNKNSIFALAGLGTVALLGFLAFGVFGIHTAFLDKEVSEGGPEFVSGAQADDAVAPADPADAAPPAEAAQPVVVTEKSGTFSGLKNYSVSGEVSVVSDGSQRFLSLGENFNSSNGPDLKVYLRAESGEFVNLGNLKGNIGDQNYEVPSETDLETFATVEIWCERFAVGFGEASLGDA